jgi:hypothetical protein
MFTSGFRPPSSLMGALATPIRTVNGQRSTVNRAPANSVNRQLGLRACRRS